ncbi:MAG TPA: hypothetical protein PKH33_13455 [bacterium]|nr:hypothetical protein [bacterium]
MDLKTTGKSRLPWHWSRINGVLRTESDMGTAAEVNSSAFGDQLVSDAIPKTWEERAVKAWQYYVEEPIVQNAINSWRTFAIGDEIQFNCDDEDVKWEVRDFAERVELNKLIKDSVLQCLVKGETICFKRPAKDGKDIEEVVCVNPISVKLRHENGKLVEATQTPETGEPIDLPLDQLLHIKWNAPSYSARGNSMVVTAFESVELLRDYRKAERAVAKRWTTPLRFIQVGGQFGQKTIIPDQKTLNSVRDMLNRMDLKAGLVVPFYVKAETYGTEGQVLDTEKKIKEIKEDIIIALGLAKSLITGDGPNFATAAIGMQKMVIMLKEIKQVARNILNWIIWDWQKLHGYEEKSINYIFNDLDLTNEVDIKKLYIELFDRKLISRNSLQIKMDLNPEVEDSHTETESKQPIDVTDPKIIIDMVNSGIMSVEIAQEKLGLDKQKNRPATADWNYRPPTATGDFEFDTICDECEFFDDENNWCDALNRETRFDSRACRSFEKKRDKEACKCGQ